MKIKIFLILVLILIFSFIYGFANFKNSSSSGSDIILKYIFKSQPEDLDIRVMFVGDIFFGRYMDKLSNASKTAGYSYPFSGLKTFEKKQNENWVGNLECPVTEKQATMKESETILKLSCRPEYLPVLAKYFDVLSLANNHTDNINGREGLVETRINLSKYNINYFGDYDSSKEEDVCKIIYIKILETESIKKFPVVFCGYHGVYSLPTDEELEIISEYSKYFITFVMPHQGEEYMPIANTYQKKIYRKMIDFGADVVVGSHPHVVQNIEKYKGKYIFYSLGNFIFDQQASETRRHMIVNTDLNILGYKGEYNKLKCKDISTLKCLENAALLKIEKPKYTLKYQTEKSYTDLDLITKKVPNQTPSSILE